MRRRGATHELALGCALLVGSCGGSTGALVAASWDSAVTVDELEVQTSVKGAPPATQMLTAPGGAGPMSSPFRVLIHSPSGEPLDVLVLAHQGARVVATGQLSVTPGRAEVLQIALRLETASSPRCGDGQLDPGEACDDGNREDRDGCTNACTCSRCGDGILQVFAGAANGSCAASGVEQCDDGNTVSGDGCSATCTRE